MAKFSTTAIGTTAQSGCETTEKERKKKKKKENK